MVNSAVVIGGGCIGVATALRLAQRGVRNVTVLERHSTGVGLECSFANAAILCAAHSHPLPLSISNLANWSLRSDQSVHLEWAHLSSDRQFWRFALSALRHWPRSDQQMAQSSQRMFTMAQYGIRELETTLKAIGYQIPKYRVERRGMLSLHENALTLNQEATAMRKDDNEYPYRVLTADETCSIEPALVPLVQKGSVRLGGSVFLQAEAVADPYPVSVGVYEACRKLGVQFLLGSECRRFHVENGSIKSIQISNGDQLDADVFIVCAGSDTPHLIDSRTRQALNGGTIPIYPLRGHSMTLDIPEEVEPSVFSRPVACSSRRVYLTPLGNGKLRVAGFGDFGGYERGPSGIRPDRIKQLISAVNTMIPGIVRDVDDAVHHERSVIAGFAQDDPVRAWCGLRPLSADNVPIVGRYGGSQSNLFINSGHGVMGWTSSHGSATLIADLVCHNQPDISSSHYCPNRFQ